MKKTFVAISVVILTISILFYQSKGNSIIENNKKINKKSNTVIAINLETAAGSGEYETTTDNKWPTTGYVFNRELSKCENGAILTWDDINKKVLITSNKSDKCYVYFDIFSKETPTLTISSTSGTVVKGTPQTLTYTYNGDGIVSCTPSNGTYGTCTVNTTNKTIIITHKSDGSEDFTLATAETANYLAKTQILSFKFTCFTEDTLVDVWDRKRKRKLKRKIKKIKVGDIVYTYDYVSDTLATAKVKEIHINTTREICHIIVNGEEIKTTRDHHFYVKDLGYVNAEDLKPGYLLAAGYNTYYEVEKVDYEILDYDKDMYSIELEDGTSFMVGAISIASQAMFVGVLGYILTKPKLIAVASGG